MKNNTYKLYKVTGILKPIIIVLNIFLIFCGVVYFFGATEAGDLQTGMTFFRSAGVVLIFSTIISISNLVSRNKLLANGWRRKGLKLIYDPDYKEREKEKFKKWAKKGLEV